MAALHESVLLAALLVLAVPAGAAGPAAVGPPTADSAPFDDGRSERGAADRGPDRATAPDPPFALNVTAERVGATTVEYTIRFDFHEDAENVSFEPAGASTFVSAEGLAPSPPGYARVDGAETGRLVLRENVTDRWFAVGTEAYLTTAALDGELSWSVAGEDARRSVFLDAAPYVDADWTASVAGPGAMALGGFVHFGPHERLDRRVDGQRFTMIVPPDVGDRFDPSARMAYLASVARESALGGPSGPLVVFVVPDDRGPDRVVRTIPSGGRAVRSSFYVVESVTNDTVAHEYVHTRQWFLRDTTPQTAWLVEGGAAYYDRLYDWQVGQRSLTTSVVPSLDHAGRFSDAVLSAPYEWDSSRVPYRKGASVVAYLDQRIRAETDGERTFADVVRRLNERGGVETNEAFAAVVADVAGNESLAEVTLRYVTTEAHPAADHEVVVIPADQRPPGATVVPSSTPGTEDASGTGAETGTNAATRGASGRTPGLGAAAGLAALAVLALALAARRARRR